MSLQVKTKALQALKFDGEKRPTIVTGASPRDRFLAVIKKQKDLLKAPIQKVREDGKRARGPHKWWWMGRDGQFRVTPKYGTEVVPLDPKNPNIIAGNEKDVEGVLDAIKQATEEGALDDILNDLSRKARDRLAKK